MTILLGFLHGAHVLGAVLWIGSLFTLGHVTSPSAETLETIHRVRLMGPVIQRTSRLGWIGLILLILTGVHLLFHSHISLFTYLGRMILLKLMIVGIMIGAFVYGHFALFADYRKYLAKIDENLTPDESSKVVRFLDELRVSIGRWFRFVAYSGLLILLLIEIGIYLG